MKKSHIGSSGEPFEAKNGVIIPYHGANMNPRDYKGGLVLVDKKILKNIG